MSTVYAPNPIPGHRMPYAMGAIVRFSTTKHPEELYLISKIDITGYTINFNADRKVNRVRNASIFTKYALIGHSLLNTAGYNAAWFTHEELLIVENPSIRSWALLAEAIDDAYDYPG